MRRIAALLCVLLALAVCGMAETAADLTGKCEITTPGKTTDNVHDGLYTSYWSNKEQKGGYLEFRTPDGSAAHWLYICFGEIPLSWAIEEETGGVWQTLHTGDGEYAHQVIPLGGKTHFRLIDTSGKRNQFKINEVFVFGEGDLPNWVQQWEPPVEKADLMLIAAHPDDELIFFGGAIPYYGGELKKNVAVVYMSYSNTTRRSELLNGLWSMGVRHYPVIGEFKDTYCSKLEAAYQRWRQKDVDAFLTDVLRHYKPEVVVTHDVKGEYGHGAHKLCADAVQRCVQRAAEGGFDEASLQKWGTWQVKKLYLHLYPEGEIVMDWRKPLQAFGGATALELAQQAYTYHVTQAHTDFVVTDEGETGNARFGLAYTAVGEDVRKDDFLENIESQAAQPPEAEPDQAPAALQQDAGVQEPGPQQLPEVTVQSADGTGPEEAAGQTAAAPEKEPGHYGKARAEVEWPVTQPELDAYGYPLTGETVFSDGDEGIWFYASPTLVVRVDRIFEPEKPLTWYEAQIFCDRDAERFGATLYNPEKPQKKHVQASLIARENQIVFAMNTDYYTYRLGRKTKTGMIIRNRNIFFDRVPEANRRQFPNLDTLAMYEDGSWRVFRSDELTGQQYLDDGAVDVFAFGPYLVRNGQPSDFVPKMKNGKTEQPRCALGMIEPGHYFAILAEGRMKKVSVGVNIEWLEERMLAAGCTEALNFDGGQTAVMCFMGEQITRIGRYAGGRTTPRETTEVMGIGHSSRIDPNAKSSK